MDRKLNVIGVPMGAWVGVLVEVLGIVLSGVLVGVPVGVAAWREHLGAGGRVGGSGGRCGFTASAGAHQQEGQQQDC